MRTRIGQTRVPALLTNTLKMHNEMPNQPDSAGGLSKTVFQNHRLTTGNTDSGSIYRSESRGALALNASSYARLPGEVATGGSCRFNEVYRCTMVDATWDIRMSNP